MRQLWCTLLVCSVCALDDLERARSAQSTTATINRDLYALRAFCHLECFPSTSLSVECCRRLADLRQVRDDHELHAEMSMRPLVDIVVRGLRRPSDNYCIFHMLGEYLRDPFSDHFCLSQGAT